MSKPRQDEQIAFDTWDNMPQDTFVNTLKNNRTFMENKDKKPRSPLMDYLQRRFKRAKK